MLIHHQRNSPLGQGAHFGNRQRDVIRRHRHGLGVEVTAGDHLVFLGEHQRVIGHRVGFHQQHFCGLAQLRQTRAHHLRLTAQRVRILYLVTVMVRISNLTGLRQQMAIHCGSVNLPALATYVMNTRVKRTTRAQHRLRGQRTAHHGRGEQIFGFKQTAQRKGRGGLRAVKQRQPLFCRKGDWR